MQLRSYFKNAGRSLRSMVAVGIIGILIVSLLTVRNKLEQEERRAAFATSAMSWKISETLLEAQRMVTALVAFPSGTTTRDDVIFASELFWSRISILLVSEFRRHQVLNDIATKMEDLLIENEAIIYDAPEFTDNDAARIKEALVAHTQALRAIWIQEFLGNPEAMSATVASENVHTRELFERLIIGCIGLLGLYVMAEIRGAQRAQSRERALREQAMSASKAKSRFIANVSHEIRTPLNGVIGMAQELTETAQSCEQKELTDVIVSSAEVLLTTINDVLDLSKMESERLVLEDTTFDAAEQIKISTTLYGSMARAKGLSLITDVEGALPVLVRGDAMRFAQVVNNLVSNAIKFTADGTVMVSLGMRSREAQHAIDVDVIVRDTGVGISPDAMEHIFQPFSQADSSTTRQHGGTGLGLTIARTICKEMGGNIVVTSEPGQGSTFIASFLLGVGDANAVPARPKLDRLTDPHRTKEAGKAAAPLAVVATEPDCAEPERGPRILLVDDSSTNRVVMKRLLKSLNPIIHEAECGADAVRLAKAGPYDLILMDIQMPGMDGVEATAQIRAGENATHEKAHTPIIAVTANVMAHQVASYLENGMDQVVAKPVRKAEILDVIDHLQKIRAA